MEQTAADWAKAQQLRAFLARLKEAVIHESAPNNPENTWERWFTWAYDYTDRLDPVMKPQATRDAIYGLET